MDDHTPIADGASAIDSWFDFDLPNRAYIGRVEIDGEAGYAIRAADGGGEALAMTGGGRSGTEELT